MGSLGSGGLPEPTPAWLPVVGALAGEAFDARPGAVGERIVFVHGFTQTGRSWQPIAEHVARFGYEVVTVDAPGHGRSGHATANMRRAADLIGQTGGRATYVGYSMGGRMCLHLALAYPHLVEGLVLIGATPGIEDDAERDARRAADDRLADHIVDCGLEAFLDEWLSQPLFAGLRLSDADRADRLRNTAEGLAASLRHAGTGRQLPLWSQLDQLAMPVLCVAGSLDEKFSAIGRQLVARLDDGTFAAIEGASHAAHLQRREEFVELLVGWMRATALRRTQGQRHPDARRRAQ